MEKMSRVLKGMMMRPALVVVISVVLLIYGLHELFLPYVGPLRNLTLTGIQLPLVILKPPSLAHIAITLLVPLLSIIAGAMLLLKRRAGWWLATIVLSFTGFLYILSFIRGVYVPELMHGYLGRIDIELLVRAVLFFASFFYLLRRSVWSLYFEDVPSIKVIALGVFLGNVVFALLIYRW